MKWFASIYRQWRRANYANRLGWWLLGEVFRAGNDEMRGSWAVRNSNRIYRLVRGHGNPWKPYKGY